MTEQETQTIEHILITATKPTGSRDTDVHICASGAEG